MKYIIIEEFKNKDLKKEINKIVKNILKLSDNLEKI